MVAETQMKPLWVMKSMMPRANRWQGRADVDRELTARRPEAQPHATLCGLEPKSCLKIWM
ncbi:hypothetical protein AGR1A_Lc110030 [Agrobacterium fabacearum CFBP 5771]|nr:hypothetical protein AGR1A_Lc110030 [Agrobacterium fabacearum CFBP 5771]